jgi:biotin operon repressor
MFCPDGEILGFSMTVHVDPKKLSQLDQLSNQLKKSHSALIDEGLRILSEIPFVKKSTKKRATHQMTHKEVFCDSKSSLKDKSFSREASLILRYLKKESPLPRNTLSDKLDMSSYKVKNGTDELEKRGLVILERRERHIFVSLKLDKS